MAACSRPIPRGSVSGFNGWLAAAGRPFCFLGVVILFLGCAVCGDLRLAAILFHFADLRDQRPELRSARKHSATKYLVKCFFTVLINQNLDFIDSPGGNGQASSSGPFIGNKRLAGKSGLRLLFPCSRWIASIPAVTESCVVDPDQSSGQFKPALFHNDSMSEIAKIQ